MQFLLMVIINFMIFNARPVIGFAGNDFLVTGFLMVIIYFMIVLFQHDLSCTVNFVIWILSVYCSMFYNNFRVKYHILLYIVLQSIRLSSQFKNKLITAT